MIVAGTGQSPASPGSSGDDPSSGAFTASVVLRNTREDIESAQKRLLAAAERLGYDQASCFAMRLALEEAVSNGFKHGNRSDPDKTVTVSMRVDRDATEIDVQDEGDGFDPETIPDPTLTENIEIPSGRGIVLMRAYMTTVSFQPPGNRVRMRYERAGG